MLLSTIVLFAILADVIVLFVILSYVIVLSVKYEAFIVFTKLFTCKLFIYALFQYLLLEPNCEVLPKGIMFPLTLMFALKLTSFPIKLISLESSSLLKASSVK